MLIVFALAIFVSAALLFLVQPMVARMVLPLLGGTPAVWNTCMLFFQALLLGGYAYAHGLTRVRRPGVQVAVHAVVCALPVLLLPVGLREGASPPAAGSPVPWLLGALGLAVGGPFFVLSATGPLLQRWFSTTTHRAARDPYFLYAASNAGSLLALLAYPFLVEPSLKLEAQGAAWSAGYAVLAVLLVVCGVMAARRQGAPAEVRGATTCPAGAAGAPAVSWRTGAVWVLLAFAPSSLMLGATSYISTDLAAVPLLWILPLTAYLLTMIVAFSRYGPGALRAARLATPVLALLLAVTMLMQLKGPVGLLVPLHLLLLLAGAMACHGRLAALRPPPEHLTAYFLLVSLGGVLGGVFNALVAPAVLPAVFEYPAAIALACWLGMSPMRPSAGGPAGRVGGLFLDVALPLAVVGSLFATWKLARSMELALWAEWAVSLSIPVVGCVVLMLWPRRFALAVGMIMVLAVMSVGGQGRVQLAERSFFGVHRVIDAPDGRSRKMLHGSTNHGVQWLEPGAPGTPLTYYTRSGPAGQVFSALNGAMRLREVALVGLGTGSLAAYARPGQRFVFYEIDPVVVKAATDPRLFSFLSGSAGEVKTVLGDGRLSLKRDTQGAYDLIVLDAFSSDAIPVHLLTVEAFEVYLSRLAERGLILVHLSNRHLDLRPVVAGVAAQAGLVARFNEDKPGPGEAARWAAEWKAESLWAIVARRELDLGALALEKRWAAPAGPGVVWTDDFSNIVEVLKR